MDQIKANWEKIVLFVVTLVVVLTSIGLVRQSLSYPAGFEMKKGTPGETVVSPDFDVVAEAQGLIDEQINWALPVRGQGAQRRKLPLFVSIPIVEVNGNQINMLDPNAELIRPPVTNQWLMENNLDFLRSSILEEDSDGDRFSNIEEWEAKTGPTDPADHPLYVNKLEFLKREQQSYTIRFAARPDPQTFQISRVPSGAWPKRKTFLMGIGDTSDDGQFRIESIEEKKAANSVGIMADSSELTVTHIPTGATHQVTRGIDYTIPTYFAEMKFPLGDNKPFYKKIGESFALDLDPQTKYKVVDIQSDQVVISPGAGKPDVVVTQGSE